MGTREKRAAWVGLGLLLAGCQTPSSVAASASSQATSENSSVSAASSAPSSDESAQAGGDSMLQLGQSMAASADGSRNSSADSVEWSRTDSASSNAPSAPVISTVAMGATAVGIGVIIWSATQSAPGAPAPEEVEQAAQVYLRARLHQLREDLALGAGPTVEDLAAMARIRRAHLDAFGRLLREHRAELLALAGGGPLSPERARAWLQRVGEIARSSPLLEEDRRVFFTALEGAD